AQLQQFYDGGRWELGLSPTRPQPDEVRPVDQLLSPEDQVSKAAAGKIAGDILSKACRDEIGIDAPLHDYPIRKLPP
ncbi:MAG: hypothetical protein ACREEP_04790, partial [Dongiaceae bacterium]